MFEIILYSTLCRTKFKRCLNLSIGVFNSKSMLISTPIMYIACIRYNPLSVFCVAEKGNILRKLPQISWKQKWPEKILLFNLLI